MVRTDDVARTLSERNKRVYLSPHVVEVYAGSFRERGLLEPEQFILDYLGPEIAGKDVLDIGVGGGRTTPFLQPVSRRYVGIDYSEPMVAQCRARHANVDFRVCDAIDVGRLGAGEFDLVFFSLNGIDHASHANRITILDGIHRVLRPGGLFVFSSHNLDGKRWRPLLLPRLQRAGAGEFLSMNARHLAAHCRRLVNYHRNRYRQEWGDGYAVLVDQAHDYRLLMYHIGIDSQIGQLAQRGFVDVEMVDTTGRLLPRGAESRDGWIYYIARTPAFRST